MVVVDERPSPLDETRVLPGRKLEGRCEFAREGETRHGSEVPFVYGHDARVAGQAIPVVRERGRGERWRRSK